MGNNTELDLKQPEIDHSYVPELPGQVVIKTTATQKKDSPFVLCISCSYPTREIQAYKGKCSSCGKEYDPALIYQPPFCNCFHANRAHWGRCQVKGCKCTNFQEFKTNKKMCTECKGAGHKGDAKNCVGCAGAGWL